MSSIPSLKPREVEKILLHHSFVLQRQSGSHRVYYNQEADAVVIVPFHTRDVPAGTLRSIVKQSKLTIEEFFK